MTQCNTKIIKWESINPHKVHLWSWKNKNCHQKFSCVTFIILYRFYSNIQRSFQNGSILKSFSQELNMKMLFNNLRRVVKKKKTEYFRFLDSKAKHSVSSHSNYAGYHPITNIMWS